MLTYSKLVVKSYTSLGSYHPRRINLLHNYLAKRKRLLWSDLIKSITFKNDFDKKFRININRFYEFVDHCYNQCLFEVCDVSKCGM